MMNKSRNKNGKLIAMRLEQFSLRGPVKICHVTRSDNSIKMLLLNQLKSLMEEGYKVSVACTPEGGWIENIESEGIHVKCLSIKSAITPFADLFSLIQMILFFRKERFKIVHAHTPKIGLLGQLAARLAGVPIVIRTLHGYYFQESTPFLKKQFFILSERIAALCSDIILSQNPEDIETAKRKKICKMTKIRLLGNGIDIQRFDPSNIQNDRLDEIRQELGLKKGESVIGIVARFTKEKGFLELFEAFRKIREELPAKLLIVGSTQRNKSDVLETNVVKDFGIEDDVIFAGFCKDVEHFYPLMDVFALPSHREGFPRAAMEAASMSRPIVAANIRGCRQVVEDGFNGLLVPVKDPNALSKALLQLLRNPHLLEQMGLNARRKAEMEFNEQKVFSIVKKTYKELINKKLLKEV